MLLRLLLLSLSLTSALAKYNGFEANLLHKLLANYSKYGRPVKDARTSVDVYVDLSLATVVDVDLKNEIILSNVQLIQQWRDEFIQWDPEENDGLLRLEIDPTLLWLPDVTLVNSADDYQIEPEYPSVVVLYNGAATWNPRMQLRSVCEMDATMFPFDTQTCYLLFFSWTYSDEKMRVHGGQSPTIIFVDQSSAASAFYVPNSTIHIRTINETMPIGDRLVTTSYTQLLFGMKLQRKVLYHSYTVLLPAIVISILTTFTFCVKPDSGEKVSLGVSVLLVFHLMLWSIGEQLPENANGVPLLAIYLTAVMTLSSTSVMASVGIINVYKTGGYMEMPAWIRSLFLGHLASLFGLHHPSYKRRQTISDTLGTEDSPSESSSFMLVEDLADQRETEPSQLAQDWELVARVIDRMLFFVYLVTSSLLIIFLLIFYPLVMQPDMSFNVEEF